MTRLPDQPPPVPVTVILIFLVSAPVAGVVSLLLRWMGWGSTAAAMYSVIMCAALFGYWAIKIDMKRWPR
jgi:uncharacterized membrane protein YraQ (UPF0718 family)